MDDRVVVAMLIPFTDHPAEASVHCSVPWSLDSGLSPIADPVKQILSSFLLVLHPSPFSGGLSRRLRNNLEDISIMGFCVIYYRPEVT